jgi:hypothetical protein
VEVRTCVIVDPPAEVENCVMVVALGVGVADVERGSDEDEGVDELKEIGVEEELGDSGVLLIEEDEELMGRLVEDDEMVEESEVETGVGPLLAIELDD